MGTLNMIVGIPCSGKSTFRNMLSGKVICPDELRKVVYREDFNVEHEGLMWAKIIPDIFNHWIYKSEDIVYDATNVDKSTRRKILRMVDRICADLGVHYERVAYYIHTPLEEALTRNVLSSRQIPQDVIIRMNDKLIVPTLEEGFSKVYKITTNAVKGQNHPPIYQYLQEQLYT